jgi:[ribosomal protein S5]-alanine N-acetyltransferase
MDTAAPAPLLPRDVFATERLLLRKLDPGDADFIFGLVNDPDWLRYIGDRGVRNLEDAHAYIANGPVAMYDRLGLGLLAVERRDDCTPIGICGVLKRDGLDHVDLGFAFLPAYRSQGYALEAAAATLEWARAARGIGRVLAITSRDNARSASLLGKLGFVLEGEVRLQGAEESVRLYAVSLRDPVTVLR